MGEIINLPIPKKKAEPEPVARICSNCENAAFSNHGIHCLAFHEDIWDEEEAATCDAFESEEPVVVAKVVDLEQKKSSKSRKAHPAGTDVHAPFEIGDIPKELIEACDKYLLSLRCVLWGQAFDVNSDDGRRRASEWLAKEIIGLGLGMADD